MIELNLKVLFKYIKLRVLLISLLIIVLTPIFSIWLPLYPDFNPEYSIYSNQDLGSSNLLNTLSEYEVDRSSNGEIATYDNYDLIVINTPQRDLDVENINALTDLNQDHSVKLLIIGIEHLSILTGYFQIYFEGDPTGDNRIFDTELNGGDKVYPQLNGLGISNAYGVVPASIMYSGDTSSPNLIRTSPNSAFAGCWDNDSPCEEERVVGIINPGYAIIGDEWMFKNSYTSEFPGNNDLFRTLVSTLIGEEGTILFEESFLKWAPVNPEGVDNFINVQLQLGLIVFVISIFGIGIPGIIGFQSNVFGKNSKKKTKSRQYDSVEQRLSYIHVERLPAAPLNLLERTLMDQQLRLNQRGKFYFQFAANQLIEYIVSKRLVSKIPDKMYSDLIRLKSGVYSAQSSWKLLKKIYDYLLQNEIYKK